MLFEEELDLRRFNHETAPTAGLECTISNRKVILNGMTPSTPGA
jgi:hypothetical protein